MDISSVMFSEPLNFWFCSVIFGLAALALVGIWRGSGWTSRLAGVAPGVLTGLGVLGTFVGIFQGLISFDVRDISASVPFLLDGMKTAFVTSVIGMGCGLVVKVCAEIFRTQSDARQDASAADIVAGLALLEASNREGLDRLRGAISGDGDGSLVTQMQKLRTTLDDRLQSNGKLVSDLGSEVLVEIKNISTRLAEDNAKAFMEALERAIQDFNTKITEQFGENFKHLNTAVGRLLEWQEQYRLQMADMAERLRQATEAANQSADALTTIASRSEAIVEASAQLAALLKSYAAAQADIERKLEAFSGMAARAQSALPVVEERLRAMTDGFGNAVEDAVKRAREIAEEQSASFNGIKAGLEQMRKTNEETAKAVAKQATDVLAAIEQQARRAMEASSSQLETVISQTNDRVGIRLEEHARKLAERLDKQVYELDAALQDELTRSIELLGSRLAAVSEHLAADYTRLAVKLNEIARRANDE